MIKLIILACCGLFLACCHGGGHPGRAGAGEVQAPCPDSPNCVSSLAGSERQRIDPLRLYGPPADSMALLGKVVQAMPRVKVTFASNRFLFAEFRSILGFVDDVACMADEAKGVIEIRSASRVGYWDFGVNRRRVERIREIYETAAAAPAKK